MGTVAHDSEDAIQSPESNHLTICSFVNRDTFIDACACPAKQAINWPLHVSWYRMHEQKLAHLQLSPSLIPRLPEELKWGRPGNKVS